MNQWERHIKAIPHNWNICSSAIKVFFSYIEIQWDIPSIPYALTQTIFANAHVQYQVHQPAISMRHSANALCSAKREFLMRCGLPCSNGNFWWKAWCSTIPKCCFSPQDLTSKMFATRYDLYRRHFSDLHTLQFETVVASINNGL